MMRLDLTDLRLFICVAEAASITRGAAKVNMALPSASERIRNMEAALGVTLLERGRRGVKLTPPGRSLVHHAQLVLQQMEYMRSELAEYSSGLKGYVRLLANTSALSEFLPEHLNTFLAAHPGIDVDIEERPSYDIVRAVAEGFADVGIVADIVDIGSLESFPFAIDRLAVVMPHNHPLAEHQRLSFREVLAHSVVGMIGSNALQQHLGQHALQAGQPLKLRVRLGSFDAICRMVANGIGVAVIPETAARRNAKVMPLRIVRLVDSWSVRRLSVCVRRRSDLPSYAQQLVEHLSRRTEST